MAFISPEPGQFHTFHDCVYHYFAKRADQGCSAHDIVAIFGALNHWETEIAQCWHELDPDKLKVGGMVSMAPMQQRSGAGDDYTLAVRTNNG